MLKKNEPAGSGSLKATNICVCGGKYTINYQKAYCRLHGKPTCF